MEKLVINKLGPIEHCELEIKDFMVFTGPQASGAYCEAKRPDLRSKTAAFRF